MPKLRLLTLALLLAAGSAHAGLFSDDDARKQITELKQQLAQMQTDNQALTDRLAKLEAQVHDLKLTDILNQLQSESDQIAKLRGQLEVQAYQTDNLQKRQKDLYSDADNRLRALETATKPATAPATAPASAAAAAPATDETSYNAALDQYKVGNYSGAISAFQQFLSSYPQSKLAPNAEYWMGFSYSATKDCKSAIATHQQMLQQYPDSTKVPDALLNMANCQLALKDHVAARKTLHLLVSKFPLTPAGDQGKKLMAELQKK